MLTSASHILKLICLSGTQVLTCTDFIWNTWPLGISFNIDLYFIALLLLNEACQWIHIFLHFLLSPQVFLKGRVRDVLLSSLACSLYRDVLNVFS